MDDELPLEEAEQLARLLALVHHCHWLYGSRGT